MYKINKQELRADFDIDETLVMEHPEDYPGAEIIQLNYYGHKRLRAIHKEQVELLKAYKKRGYYIRAHSNNGWQWVKEVVDKLELQDFVNEIECKATKRVDDEAVPGGHVYIPMRKG